MRRAIAANRGSARIASHRVSIGYALFLDLIGHPRAADTQLQRVRQLDPVSPHAYYALAYHLFLARR